MKQYIDKDVLVTELKYRIKECDKLANLAADNNLPNTLQANKLLISQYTNLIHFIDALEVKEVDLDKERFPLQQENPEPYFYCKYGGTMPLCSDCKRNHNNSSFKTEEITTWYAPSNGTKHCIDYIKQSEMDLEKELDKEWNKCEPIDEGMGLEIASIEHEQFDNIAKYFYELGLKAQK